MKIVIATGIYPPEVGGPALYAKGVQESLERMGHDTRLVVFSELRRYPSGIRHLLFVVQLIRAAYGADAIFAFDTASAGVPSAVVGALMRMPIVVRVGGDFVWERYVERTHSLIPLPVFYEQTPMLDLKTRLARAMIAWMIHRSLLAFNTRWLLEIWQKAYGFSPQRACVIGNVIPQRRAAGASDGVVLLYGRPLALKNAAAFRRALQKADTTLRIEEGTLPHEQFLQRVASAHAVVVPSISDVAPNSVVDAITCGKPFILTKYSGYAETFGDMGIIVDPLSEEDMARGIRELAEPAVYERLSKNIAAFIAVRTYDDIAVEFMHLLKQT